MTTGHAEPTLSSTQRWSGAARAVGWLLCVGMIALLVGTVSSGERPTSMQKLEQALDAGDVQVVGVSGGAPRAPGHQGSGILELHWREGIVRYRADVVEATPGAVGDPGISGDGALPVGVVDRLVQQHPGLRIEQVPSSHRSGIFGVSAGWEVVGPLAGLSFALVLATLGLLVLGPQPWRATRWAWFWLVGGLPPFGALAYLVLGGPTGLVGAPRAGSLRLTGGWAFLISLLVGSALSSAGWLAR